MSEFALGNIFIRTNGEVQGVAPGTVIKGHKHNFDHVAIFFNGRWRASKGDVVIEREGPFFLLIEADSFHEFTYAEDNAGPGYSWCVFSHRNAQGEVIEHYDGWRDAHELKERQPDAER